MRSHSFMSVRVIEIPREIKEEDLKEVAQCLCEPRGSRSSFCSALLGSLPLKASPVISLAPQFEGKIGTITFPSEKLKRRALKDHKTEWVLSDQFNGLTVLYSAVEPDLESICAIHGLNGNAFDTWAGGSNMWLRDFLPTHYLFAKSRVMTFGYSSRLRDSGNLSGLKEWSISLLNGMSSVRISEPERSRPVIFVCHSLGGLVARQAMIRLAQFPEEHRGLDLRQCGLLFLSTPHSGSNEASWNKYFRYLGDAFGLRSDSFSNMLKTFNEQSVQSKEYFGTINPAPPFECLYETRITRIGCIPRHIVTADSAGLNGRPATPMADVDHRTICRFSRKSDEGYIQILECLGRIRKQLLNTLTCYEESPQPDISFSGVGSGTNWDRHHARGGDAQGGHAQGAAARGGNARGGNAHGTGARGGNARGGDAKGDDACACLDAERNP